MSKKAILWLYQQLPALLKDEVLDEESVKRLQQYYGDVKPRNYTQTLLMIFGAIGAILVGLGIILLIAFNWHNFGKFIRTLIAFIPLLGAHVLVLFTFFKKQNKRVWQESSGLFMVCAIYASLAIIGQTYNVSGDIGTLLLICSLLTLPLVYILKSRITALLYLMSITVWSAYTQIEGGYSIFFWVLFLFYLPQLILEIRKDRFSNGAAFFGWLTALCLTVATGVTLEKVMPGL